MGNSLSEEIRSLSDEDLNEYIDTFENRVETTRDYLDDCDSIDISMVMRGKLREYSLNYNCYAKNEHVEIKTKINMGFFDSLFGKKKTSRFKAYRLSTKS